MADLMLLTEGDAQFYASEGKITADMAVFYNPRMRFNRDSTVALLNALERKPMRCCDLMAGSGIRSIRLLKECPKVESIVANDVSSEAIEAIRKNLHLNGLADDKRIELSQEDALRCLALQTAFDYVDLDPFGSPNRYLPLAVERTKHKGILAVTATDTSVLSGSYARTCMRKYWARPLRNELMHEVGLRILMRKVQLLGASLELAMTPIYSFSTDHYMRIFFEASRGKKKVDELLSHHMYLLYCQKCGNRFTSLENVHHCCGSKMLFAGPLYCGSLWDAALAENIGAALPGTPADIIGREATITSIGFYDLHKTAKHRGGGSIPRKKDMLARLHEEGYKAQETHFLPTGIRTDCPYGRFLEIFDLLRDRI